MKTKRIIYFLCIVAGAIVLGISQFVVQEEYYLSVGFILLMFGIYNTSKVWSIGAGNNNQEQDNNIEG